MSYSGGALYLAVLTLWWWRQSAAILSLESFTHVFLRLFQGSHSVLTEGGFLD